MKHLSIDQIRSDFPQLNTNINGKKLFYFDNAATSLKPKVVIDRITNYYQNEVANVHRGVHTLSERGTIFFEETRTTVSKFINSKNTNEIIFTKGTTDSINLLAQSFSEYNLKKDDEIIISTMEHHSNIVPWQMAALKKGAKIVEAKINDNGELDFDYFLKLLNPKVKLISLCHISNTLGTINPIKLIIEKAHQLNILVHIDAAQSISHLKIDVRDLDVDFLSFSAHKMFGPNGVGILYGKEELLEKLPPYQGGGAMIQNVDITHSSYNTLPFKFEAGTPVIAEIIAFKEALNYISNIGHDFIIERENKLLHHLENKIKNISGLKIIGNAKHKSSVVSFDISGIHPHDIGTLLNQYGIAIRTGHHCTLPLLKYFNLPFVSRASIAFYNTEDEIDFLYDSLNKAIKLLN